MSSILLQSPMVNPTARKPKAASKKGTGIHSRSRAGCLTCKAKHLKCDETRPACQQCSKKGIKCGGYAQGLKWSFKHQPAPHRIIQPKSPSQDQDDISQSSAPRSAGEPSPSPATSPSYTFCPSPPTIAESRQRVFPSPCRDLVDPSSAYITSWFRDVCRAWSGYDSDTNTNRKIAIDHWQTSPSVRSSLESMSAGFLASRSPSLRPSALRLMGKATECIQTELETFKAIPQDPGAIPTGLLFSLFCLGTTVCWVDSRGLGIPFLREARSLVQRLNEQRSTRLDGEDELMLFFNKSLAYSEMLLAVVRDDESLEHQEPSSQPLGLELEERSPHPWTGVSPKATRLFTETMRLCRSSRHRMRRLMAIDPQRYFSSALRDLMVAQRLEEQLLALEFPLDSSTPDANSSTGDEATPVAHLSRIAEAYKISSLLHLYQTFPDLVSLRLPAGSPWKETGAGVPWSEWIVPLALWLVKVLEHIPTTSGSRVIQPLLYISAATGLRHDCSTVWSEDYVMGEMLADLIGKPPIVESHDLSSYISQITVGADPVQEPQLTNDIEVQISSARHFVMRRLGILESSLPPTPVVVAKDLVQSVWRAYDSEIGPPTVHWIDVMEDNNLRSLFG